MAGEAEDPRADPAHQGFRRRREGQADVRGNRTGQPGLGPDSSRGKAGRLPLVRRGAGLRLGERGPLPVPEDEPRVPQEAVHRLARAAPQWSDYHRQSWDYISPFGRCVPDVKVKASPADFVVQEEAELFLSARPAQYAVFRLSKTSWDTFDLIDLLSRRWGVRRGDISVGGIKDRHGSTEQTISVRGLRGRPAPIHDTNFRLTFEGWAEGPVSARDIRGNRFSITLRDLTAHEAGLIAGNAPEVARHGVPNYFDTQRFGSARHGAGFMGKEIFLGRRERALRLYFTPSKHDDQKTRAMKRCVIENWGRWEKCAGTGFGEYGRILAYLAAH